MKLYEKLNLGPMPANIDFYLRNLKSSLDYSPVRDYDKASCKNDLAFARQLLAVIYVLRSEPKEALEHGDLSLKEAEDFLIGDWKSVVRVNNGKDDPDPDWWRKHMVWMDVYSGCLLWGSVLNRWDLLKRVSVFPDETGCVNSNATEQERDALVAIAAVLRGDSKEDCLRHFKRASEGSKKICKLLVATLESILNGDEAGFNKNFNDYMQQYKKAEFPKNAMTKKVSEIGTFLVHFARHRGLKVEVPTEFAPHIIDFKP